MNSHLYLSFDKQLSIAFTLHIVRHLPFCLLYPNKRSGLLCYYSNNLICKAPYGRDFRGAVWQTRPVQQCNQVHVELKACRNRAALRLLSKQQTRSVIAASSPSTFKSRLKTHLTGES